MIADTTFLIDYLNGHKGAVNLLAKNPDIQIKTTYINVYELLIGTKHEKTSDQNIRIANALIENIETLGLDRKSADTAAEISARLIKAGQKIEASDALIAGIALSNGENQIITANKNHFERIPGLKIITY